MLPDALAALEFWCHRVWCIVICLLLRVLALAHVIIVAFCFEK